MGQSDQSGVLAAARLVVEYGGREAAERWADSDEYKALSSILQHLVTSAAQAASLGSKFSNARELASIPGVSHEGQMKLFTAFNKVTSRAQELGVSLREVGDVLADYGWPGIAQSWIELDKVRNRVGIETGLG